MDVAARLEAVQEALARSEERVAQLEALLGFGFLPPREFQLTTSEARMFGVLMQREWANKDTLMAALYRDEGRDEAQIKIVDVFVCKIRKKLKPYGLVLETIWGRGYALTPASKITVHEMLKPVGAAA